MYCYKIADDKILKYCVSFDQKKIEEMKTKIIFKCSEIVHKEYRGVRGPNRHDWLKIVNYNELKVGYQEYNDAPDDVVYQFSYDELEHPYLVTLIDRLLNGDPSCIAEIFNPNYTKEPVPFDERIKVLSKKIDEIPNTDIEKKMKELEELKGLIKRKKLNEKQEPTSKYYDIIKTMIYIDLAAELPLEYLRTVENFFCNDDVHINSKKLIKNI